MEVLHVISGAESPNWGDPALCRIVSLVCRGRHLDPLFSVDEMTVIDLENDWDLKH